MRTVSGKWLDFLRDESGATAIEYGLVAVLVSTTIIIWAAQIGDSVKSFFMAAANGIKS